VTIACPECFRTFPQAAAVTANAIFDTSCVFCHAWILYGIVDPLSVEFPRRFQPGSAFTCPGTPAGQLCE